MPPLAPLQSAFLVVWVGLGVAACSPPTPAGDQVTCATGELLDGGVCVPEACGQGTWGSLPVDSGTIYVDGGDGDAGDGSEGAPLRSLQDAADLAASRGGALVVIAAGTYVETLAMGDDHTGVTLAGRCRELVTIDGREGDDVPTIEVIGARRTPDIGIEGLTITGGTYTGLWLQQTTASVTATDVRANTSVGIIAALGEITLADVGVYDTQPDRRGTLGQGIEVLAGAELTATGCTFQRNMEVGMLVSDAGTTVELIDSYILDTGPSPSQADGVGITVQDGAALTTSGCTLQGNTGAGLFASGQGTVVDLVATEILDTLPDSAGDFGRGVTVGEGAMLTAADCSLRGNTQVGLHAEGAGTEVELSNTEILDTAPTPNDVGGVGLYAAAGAVVTATGCSIQGSTEAGIYAIDAGTVLTLSDTRVLDTSSNASGLLGHGIEAADGASITATGCSSEWNTEVGVFAWGPGSIVDLVDTEVLHTRPSPDGDGAAGLFVRDGASLSATGSTIRWTPGIGILADGTDTVLILDDTAVLDTHRGRLGRADTGAGIADGQGYAVAGSTGVGVQVQDGAALTATGCVFQGSAEAGLLVTGSGATADLVDTDLLDTDPALNGQYGHGLAVQQGAAVTTDGCRIQGNSGAGVFTRGAGSTVDLTATEILDTRPGPNGSGGFGVQAHDGAALTATACRIQGNGETGVFARGASVHLIDSQVLETQSRADGTFGYGIQVDAATELFVDRCVVEGNFVVGILAGDAGTVVDLVDTQVLSTQPSPGGGGGGVHVQDGADLTATRCTIQGNTETGVVASGGGATVALMDTVVLDTQRGTNTGFAIGIVVQRDGELNASACTVAGTEGPGLYVLYGGAAELDGVEVSDNTFAGAVLLNGELTLLASTVVDTRSDAEWGGGFGVYAADEFGSPNLTMQDSSVGAHPYAAVWLDGNGAYDIEGSQLSGSTGVEQGAHMIHGNALFAENGVTAWDGAAGLSIIDTAFHDASAIAVLLDASSATMSGNTWTGNTTDVWQQRCEADGVLTEDDLLGVPTVDVCPAGNVLTAYDLRFSTLYLPEVGTAE